MTSNMFPRLSRLKCGSYLFVRSAHTLLTVGVSGSLLMTHTKIQDCFLGRSPGDLTYGLAFYLLAAFSLIMYHVTCLVDPGFVPVYKKRYADSDDEEDGENTTDLGDESTNMLGDQDSLKLRKCGFCGITQPIRARHCEECDRCVRKYDHHCPWLDTCIGENNHRFFLIFLATTAVLITWAFTIVWPAFVSRALWKVWFMDNLVLILDMCVLLPGGFSVWCLFAMHAYLALCNQTTWEIVSRPRITYLNKLDMDINPFHEGYLKNCYHFLLNSGMRRWEVVYKKSKAAIENIV